MMEVWQIKELSEKVFLTFNDELKIKMACQQFAFLEERINEIRRWLIDNSKYPYYLTTPKLDKYAWVSFVDENDAAAFKLMWM